jgi:GTP-binding protein EngB required for normal cell division
MLTLPPTIALVGKLGHGKTFLLNKLTGKHFPCHMGARSCTRTLQFGYSQQNSILVVDTPGFCASDDVAAHVAAQKLALEGSKLSGIFIIVKYARADEMGEMAGKIMTFIGSDDVRIIVTHADVVRGEKGYDPHETKVRLNELLGVAHNNITIIGKTSTAEEIEAFVQASLHEPREYKITDSQVASISTLCVAARHFNKKIDEVHAKIAAASQSCMDVAKLGKSYQCDVAIGTIQHATTNMVQEAKEAIFREVCEQDIPDEQSDIVYGKSGFPLSLRLRAFMDATNKYLSWDVTDVTDQRNIYKKCNFCGAVFNKTSGCDGKTVCGAVPEDTKLSRPRLIAEFHAAKEGWIVQYFWDGSGIQVRNLLATLLSFFASNKHKWGGNRDHIKQNGAAIESGCGAAISWSTMIPLSAEDIKCLGIVELQQSGSWETESKAGFDERLRVHQTKNKELFRQALFGKPI